MMEISDFWAISMLLAFVILYGMARVGKRESHLPHGPPTLPILGNLTIFPKTQAHFRFTEWAREYGGIYSLKLGPSTVLVLTDMAIVKDLLEKKSQVTADRPPMYGVDLVTEGMTMSLARYNDKWRIQRRIVQEILTPKACDRHLPIQQAESTQLVYDCLTDPKRFYEHINRYSLSVILSILFGKRTPRLETQELIDFNDMEESWQQVLAPGYIPPVELLPFLKYLPRFLAPWKDDCDRTRRLQHKLYYGLLRETQERIAQGYENGSFMEQVLARQSDYGLSFKEVGFLGGALIEAGGDTTAAWIKILVLALVAYPEVQQKAHEELDRVIGHERMPVLADLSRLSYIQAVLKEVQRWRPIGPLSIQHASTEEIQYAGYHIPAGTTIFTNTWGMSHNPDIYERPEDFWPDRWLLDEFGAKPGAVHHNLNPNWFGNGRRVCPGIHMANNNAAINAMNLLWAFDFNHDIDEATGEAMPVDIYDFEDGMAIWPKPFKCAMKPRSAHHAEIIEQEFLAARAVHELYEHGISAEDKEYVQSRRI